MTWGKEEAVWGLVGTGVISLGSAAGCVSVTLGRFSDACSWHSSSLECVALTGLVYGETGCGCCVGATVSVQRDCLLVKQPAPIFPS